MFKTSPENAADVDAIAKLLNEAPIGETVTYATMNDTIGRNIQKCYHIFQAARKRVEQEAGSLFEVVRNTGAKKLETAALPNVGNAGLRKVRRASRRMHERLGYPKPNDIDPAVNAKIIAQRSMFGALAMVADGRKTATLATETVKTGQVIPAGRVLDMFKD